MIIETIPLLKDHHNHPYIYVTFRNTIDLSSIYRKDEALTLINESEKEIIIATGWDNSHFSFSQDELDSLPPLVVCNISFHGYLINNLAREILQSSYPEIVTNIDDGAWVERNLFSIFKFIANINPSTSEQIKSFYDDVLLKSGIWYAEDMLLTHENIISKFIEIGYLERTNFWLDLNSYNALDPVNQKYVQGIKIFTDGALGSKTAALNEPFLTGERGVLNYSDDELHGIISSGIESDKPISIHALGDLADNQVLTTLHDIKAQRGSLPMIRLEHCQFITQENAEKAKDLGIIISMQPNFNSDAEHYADRLPEKYCKNNNPFRMLIDNVGFTPGEDLIFGSDGMPHGIPYALEQSLFPPLSGQALSIEEFVAGYCMPDMENGYIEIEIDEENKSLKTEVIVKGD